MSTFDKLKSIASILQEAGKIEQYKQILETQKELLEIQKNISDLEKENNDLKQKLEIKDSLVYENNAYWIVNNDKKDGPYCTCCWDDSKKTIRMQPCGNPDCFDCPKCNNKVVKVYHNNDYRINKNENFDSYR